MPGAGGDLPIFADGFETFKFLPHPAIEFVSGLLAWPETSEGWLNASSEPMQMFKHRQRARFGPATADQCHRVARKRPTARYDAGPLPCRDRPTSKRLHMTTSPRSCRSTPLG